VRTLVAAAVVAVACSTAHAGRTIERVVAVVNDDIILDSELEQWALPQLRAPIDLDTPEGRKSWDDHKRKVLDQLIESTLVKQQAVELKLSVTGEEVDRALDEVKRQNKLDDSTFVEALKQQGFTIEGYRKNLRRQILELKVLNTAVRSRIQITDDEVRAYYNTNARQLSGDKTAHLRQILIAVPPDAPADEIERRRKTAQKLVERARSGTSFVELAKSYSDDESTKSEGGDLGWVGKGVLVDQLDEAVSAMDTGDVRGPVRTGRGWHVLQLVERQAGALRPYDEVKDQLRKTLYDQQVEKAQGSWIKELRKRAHVDVRL
jgi:peptidyl-prolyl cis-trans isomerase SurA